MDTRKIALGTILISIATAFCLFYTIRLVILIMLIGIGVGVLLHPIVKLAREKAHLPASITAFILLLGLFAVMGGIGYSIYVIVSGQLGNAIAAIPTAYHTVIDWMTHHTPMKSNGGSGINISTAIQSTLGTVVQGAEIGLKIGAGLFYIISVALYVAVDPERTQGSFLSAFPAHLRPRVTEIMRECAHTLREWFLSHLIVVSGVGLSYALGLWLLGNPYWPLFGVLAAILDFVPYIGPFAVTIGAAAVFLATGEPMHVVWTVALSLVIQELEGHVFLPIVMKERIDLPAVQLITMAIIMGFWFGVLGVFATPPLLAVLRTVYIATYSKWMDEAQSPS